MIKLSTLSKEVATRLTTEFRDQLTCIHNSNVNYPLPKLSQLRVDCWPQALQKEKASRAGWNQTVTIAIAIQQRAADQEKVDLLTDMSQAVLEWMLDSGRWCDGKLLAFDGGFSGTDVFDKLSQYEENVFQAIMLINFKQFI